MKKEIEQEIVIGQNGNGSKTLYIWSQGKVWHFSHIHFKWLDFKWPKEDFEMAKIKNKKLRSLLYFKG